MITWNYCLTCNEIAWSRNTTLQQIKLELSYDTERIRPLWTVH